MSDEGKAPPQRGRLIFEGRRATQFWMRALQLEKEIENAQAIVGAKTERKMAAVPIIADYQVDERLKFIFVITAQVDIMGVQGGIGLIYWCSPEFEKEAFRMRDKYAKDVLQSLESKGFDEVIQIDAKKER